VKEQMKFIKPEEHGGVVFSYQMNKGDDKRIVQLPEDLPKKEKLVKEDRRIEEVDTVATQKASPKDSDSSALENTRKPLGKTARKIVDMLKAEPYSSSRDMAEELEITESGVKYHLENLKKSGHITRVGSPRNGYWKVSE